MSRKIAMANVTIYITPNLEEDLRRNDDSKYSRWSGMSYPLILQTLIDSAVY